ncbi:MAG: glutamate-5-semialdehyde dehydrogenase [Patescibacteria group bacterium]
MTLPELKNEIAKAKTASKGLLSFDAKTRQRVLSRLAALLAKNSRSIIAANQKDVREARRQGEAASFFIERLLWDRKKIDAMAAATRSIAGARDTLFETLEERRRPSGLRIRKVRFPLGLIAMIYESRPNVTIDAFMLAFKSGNALLLKGGNEIRHTNAALVALIHRALKAEGVHPDAVKDLSGLRKGLAIELLHNESIDCLIPRGGQRLVSFVREHARVPVIITGAAVVHTYVDEDADSTAAAKIICNAKTRSVSICNTLDVLLLHRKVAEKTLRLLVPALAAHSVEIRADSGSYRLLRGCGYPRLTHAKKSDYDTEFLDYILAVKIVGGFKEALQHIEAHSLGHSEAIITRSKERAAQFFRRIDAACLYLNTSTQFSDGEEFGMGGEIGISTQKLHARGPFAAAELTTYKYLVESKGAVRK